MAEGTRRSTRVPKQLAILLVGSDIEGRVFSEKTKTVVLSRHGAGIVSSYKLSAEQELVLRRLDNDMEADIRVVGQLAHESGVYTYGVAFVDPTVNFWGIEFPPPSEAERQARRTFLECSSCKGREQVEQTELESDVFLINKSLMRYCKRCGSSTLWKEASGPAPPPASKPAPLSPPPVPPASASALRESSSEGIPPYLEPETDWAPQPSRFRPQPAAPDPSATDTAAKSSTPESPATSFHSARVENRRKHVRTKVNFKACVRSEKYPEDIVTCEDMSRGGLRFKSSKRYMEQALIEVAAPYQPGAAAIFVSARIVFVQELGAEKLFRYGVSYLR
jgi:PilZ domain